MPRSKSTPSTSCSIVIATYGDEAWSDLARDRAFPTAQSQDPYEVLVGHDPDATIAGVRNELAAKAEGDWLCFLDADDELGEDYLVAMSQAFSRVPAIDPLLLTPAVSYVRKNTKMPPKFHPLGDLQDDNFLVIGTLVERSLFEKVGGFSDYPHGFEDWSLWAKCWKAGAKIVQVRKAIYYAYINPDSAHRRGWKDRKWQVEMHMRVRAELFPELSP